MSKKHIPMKCHLHPLSLYPLKAEDALVAFMQIDPTKFKFGIRKSRHKRGKAIALPTG